MVAAAAPGAIASLLVARSAFNALLLGRMSSRGIVFCFFHAVLQQLLLLLRLLLLLLLLVLMLVSSLPGAKSA